MHIFNKAMVITLKSSTLSSNDFWLPQFTKSHIWQHTR